MLKRAPALALLTISAGALGIWLTTEGVHARFTGAFLTQSGLWQTAAGAVGLGPLELYWPLTWLGLTWIGVLLAVWTGSSWRFSAVRAAAVLSLAFLGWGTLLAALILITAHLPSTRRLLHEQQPG